MNAKQLKRIVNSNIRNSNIVADIAVNGTFISIKMGGHKVSHRRIKAAMKAAKKQLPHANVWFRYGGTALTPEVAAEWQQYTAANGYWWPKLAKWAAKAARTSAKINGGLT